MNSLDLALLATAALAALAGFRLGFLRRSVGWLGLAIGLALAFALLPTLLERFGSGEEPRSFILAALILAAGALAGQLAGLLVGASMRLALPPPFRVADRVVGALLGALVIFAALWLLLPVMKAIPTWPSEQAESSAVAGFMDDRLPAAPDALGGLVEALDQLPIPTVFNDPTAAPTALAPPAAVTLDPAVTSAIAESVVKVSGAACGFLQQGSGFVVEPELVVTAAHVVTGHEATQVEHSRGGPRAGTVVYFDPDLDVALVHVPGLVAAPLELALPDLSSTGVVAGRPGGGPLELSPYELAGEVDARGRDIFGSREVERRVLVLAVDLEPGDSGAAVVDERGAVVGMAFAVSPDDANTAYALSEDELREALNQERAPVGKTDCLAR